MKALRFFLAASIVVQQGAVRDKVPLYANHAMFKGEGPSELERILHAKHLGFDMFKWDPFKGAPAESSP